MTPGMTPCCSAAPEPRWSEIPPAELARHRARIVEAVDAACQSPAFRTSTRSCEFLRHVVQLTLQGNTGALKERLIGMALLGRDAAYDTSIDAGVRVRANDVRKRLNHYNAEARWAEIQVQLSAGSYVPVFLHCPRKPLAEVPVQAAGSEALPPLSFPRLAVPTFVALSLCILCIRWEVAQQRTFTSFWEEVLRDNRAVLYLSAPASGSESSETLQLAAPLLDLADEFHRPLTPIDPSRLDDSGNGLAITVGPDLPRSTREAMQAETGRFRIVPTAGGRRIVDTQAHAPLPDQGVLLTLVAGDRPLLWIEGTNEAALQGVVERLCDQSTFPRDLAESFRSGTATQVFFPLDSNSAPFLVRYPLAEDHATGASPMAARQELRQ